jgi:hypothetical protein
MQRCSARRFGQGSITHLREALRLRPTDGVGRGAAASPKGRLNSTQDVLHSQLRIRHQRSTSFERPRLIAMLFGGSAGPSSASLNSRCIRSTMVAGACVDLSRSALPNLTPLIASLRRNAP